MRLSRIGQHIKEEPCAKQRALLGVSSSRYSSVSRGYHILCSYFFLSPLVQCMQTCTNFSTCSRRSKFRGTKFSTGTSSYSCACTRHTAVHTHHTKLSTAVPEYPKSCTRSWPWQSKFGEVNFVLEKIYMYSSVLIMSCMFIVNVGQDMRVLWKIGEQRLHFHENHKCTNWCHNIAKVAPFVAF